MGKVKPKREQHTPGPWVVDGTGIEALVRGADLSIVAARHRLSGDRHDADVRLVAAAPALLAAARAAKDNLDAALHGRRPVHNPLALGVMLEEAIRAAT